MTDWETVSKKYDNLLRFAAWQCVRSMQMEQEEAYQELSLALWTALTYYNRQRRVEIQLARIEPCDLHEKWEKRRYHGAYKSRFGKPEEARLTELAGEVDLPPVEICDKLGIYAKGIIWNKVRALGKAAGKRIKTASLDAITEEGAWI